ncbi:hypothetical protein ACOSQ2_017526 [Xanthoceras sorbifolium]
MTKTKIVDFNMHDLLTIGDNDLVVPHISTENWISTLNLTVDEDWRAWFVDVHCSQSTIVSDMSCFFLF